MQSSAIITDHVYVSEHLNHSHSIMSPSLPLITVVYYSLFSMEKSYPPSHVIAVWLYQRADFDAANDTLIDFPFKPSSSSSVDSVWDEWYQTYMRIMNNVIPTRRIKCIGNLPHFTSHLQKLILNKHCLYKAAKQLSTSSAWSKHKSFRSHVTLALRSAKSRFYQSLSSKIIHHKRFGRASTSLPPRPVVYLSISISTTILNLHP